MSKQIKISALILGVIIVIGLGALIINKLKQSPQTAQNTQNQDQAAKPNTSEPEPGQNKVVAKQGELVTGFPKDLIIESSAQITDSHKEDYPNSTQNFGTDYTTTKPIKDVFNDYLSYLTSNGYTIANKTQADKIDTIYAKKGSAVVNVSISKISSSEPTNVTVQYAIFGS